MTDGGGCWRESSWCSCLMGSPRSTSSRSQRHAVRSSRRGTGAGFPSLQAGHLRVPGSPSPPGGCPDKCVIDVTLMTPAHAGRGQADHCERSEQGAGATRAATQIHSTPDRGSRLWAPTKPPAAPSENSLLRATAGSCIMILPALPARRAASRCITCILGIPPPSARSPHPALPLPGSIPLPGHPPLLDDFSFSRRCTSSPSAIYFIVDRRGSPSPGPSEGSTSHSEPRFPFISTGRV